MALTGGFRTARQKLAFHCGNIRAVAGFPDDILHILLAEFAGPGDGSVGHGVAGHGGVGFAGAGHGRAGHAGHKDAGHAGHDNAGHADAALTLTAARKSSSVAFSTDRGPLALPSWEVRARDVSEPIRVLDPAIVRRTWRPSGPVREWIGTTAELGPDDRTLTMNFVGGSPARTDYLTAEVLASGGAVAVIPVGSP